MPVPAAKGLVDRLLRGRLWVACIAGLLAGIVFLNVSVLELNGDIAATSEQAAELREENAELRLEVARLGSSERIQRVAAARGFVMPAPGEVRYVEVRPDDGRRAALALGRPGVEATATTSPAPEAEPTAVVPAEPAG